jgi:hypothetical protein
LLYSNRHPALSLIDHSLILTPRLALSYCSPKNKVEIEFDHKISFYSLVQAGVVGQGIEYSHLFLHHFIFPRILRHHYSNLFDVPFGAGLFNDSQMIVTGGKSRPLLSAIVSLSVFTGQKYYESLSYNKGPYDWADQACFLVGTTAYLTAHAVRQRRLTAQLKPSVLAVQPPQ